jgi:hypothetical protein
MKESEVALDSGDSLVNRKRRIGGFFEELMTVG